MPRTRVTGPSGEGGTAPWTRVADPPGEGGAATPLPLRDTVPWTRVTGPPGEGGTPGVVDQSTRSGATGEGDAWATKGRQCAVLTPTRGPIRSRAPLPRTGSRLARRWPPRARQPCAKAPRHRHGNRTHRKTGSRTLPGGQQPRGSAGPLDAAPEQQPTRPSRRTGRGSLRTGTSAPRKGTDPQENREPAPHRRPPPRPKGRRRPWATSPRRPRAGACRHHEPAQRLTAATGGQRALGGSPAQEHRPPRRGGPSRMRGARPTPRARTNPRHPPRSADKDCGRCPDDAPRPQSGAKPQQAQLFELALHTGLLPSNAAPPGRTGVTRHQPLVGKGGSTRATVATLQRVDSG